MLDLVFVTLSVGFFLLCIGYISWCDRLMDPPKTQKTQKTEPVLMR